MRIFKSPQVTEKQLVFADYVSIHEQSININQMNHAKPGHMQVNREELFKRIQRQRGEVVQLVAKRVQKPAGDLIDVRVRAAQTNKKRCVHFSEIFSENDKIMA